MDGRARLSPAGRTLDARIVALPLVRGPRIDGVPSAPPFGFIPVDDHGRVRGLPDVYAAGDATDHLVKQGGLAAQQADAVAAHIAARLGAPVLPEPYRPRLRGVLETGDERHVLHDDGEPAKLAGRHLTPYLEAPQPAT